MTEEFISFTFLGKPIPWGRPIDYNGHRFNPKEYQDYKDDLADALSESYPEMVKYVNSITNRKKYYQENRYSMSLQVFRVEDRGDLSNFVKGVEDAIQNSGIILNDCQIKEYHDPFGMRIDKKNPRIEFQLVKI